MEKQSIDRDHQKRRAQSETSRFFLKKNGILFTSCVRLSLLPPSYIAASCIVIPRLLNAMLTASSSTTSHILQ